MNIYNYSNTTKEFISKTLANKNPLEVGKYLIPINATTIKPLDNKADYAVCFNEEVKKWEYAEDNRGKIVYSKTTKEKIEVDYLGKIKAEHTLLKPNDFDFWDFDKNCWIENVKLKEKNRTDTINAATREYITNRYPIEKQSSANLGIYGDEYKNEMILFISNIIEKSNLAIANGISLEDFKESL